MNRLLGQRATAAPRRGAGFLLRSVLVAGLGSLLLAPGLALADSGKEQARIEFDKAQIQYKVGHFQDALDAYSRAYELFPAPAFLFNIGQCHKNLKNYERAVFFFEGYLREEKNPTKRALAEDLLAESKTALEKQAAQMPPQPAPPASRSAEASPGGTALATRPLTDGSPSVPPSAAPRSPGAPVLIGAAAEPAPAAPARSGPPWWVWVALGGVAAAAAGGYLYWSSGGTTVDPPSGSLGTLDRRAP